MSTKIVKTLKFPNNSDEFQINARYLNGEEMPTTLPNPKALTVGSKTYTGSSAVTITAADLGLASAMKFLGRSATAITDGATTNPITIGSTSTTVTSGNVVLYGSKEFVWDGSSWEELGNEGSYKVVQTAVSSPSASGTAYQFIDSISQNTQGVITATKKSVREASSSQSGLMTSAQFTKLAGIAEGADAVSFSQSLTSGTKVGTITINGTGTDLFAPTNTDTNYYHTTGSWSGLTYTAKANGGAGALAFTIPTGTTSTTVSVGNHTHNYAGSSSAGGAATSANKLNTNAGDYNTPVYFANGVPVACTSYEEANLTWGGKSTSGTVTPVGAAMSAEHSANRLAFLNPKALSLEYSNDGGSTWTTGTWSDANKINHVTKSSSITIGSDSTVTTNHRTRVTLSAQDGTNGYVYTRPRKLLLNVSSAGHGLTVTIEYKDGTTSGTWNTLGTYAVSGWSDWNDIDVSAVRTMGGAKTQTGNYWYWRFTYAVTSVNSSYATTKATVLGMRLFGETCWAKTSNMGETGHLYAYDENQNATFPAKITATSFVGSLSGNATSATTATSATKATQDASGNVITTTYAKKSELNTDSVSSGTETWIFNCGTSTTVLD